VGISEAYIRHLTTTVTKPEIANSESGYLRGLITQMEQEEKRKKTPGRMGIRGSPFPCLGVIEVKSILDLQSIVNRQSPEQAIFKNPTTNSSTWQN
jgi:hypothetical protein